MLRAGIGIEVSPISEFLHINIIFICYINPCTFWYSCDADQLAAHTPKCSLMHAKSTVAVVRPRTI